MKKKVLLLIPITLLAISCSTTRPMLNHSGGNYNSVSDDILIHNSIQLAVESIANTLNPDKKILIIQLVKNANNDLLADRIYEEMYKRGYTVGKANQNEIDDQKSKYFDKFLLFYPTVFGTETAQTVPSRLTNLLLFVPVVGWAAYPFAYASNDYEDRQAGVSIHCRLVDSKTGEIEWIRDFTGQDMIRLKGGLKQIVFPNK